MPVIRAQDADRRMVGSLRAAWSTEWNLGQLRIHSKNHLKTKKAAKCSPYLNIGLTLTFKMHFTFHWNEVEDSSNLQCTDAYSISPERTKLYPQAGRVLETNCNPYLTEIPCIETALFSLSHQRQERIWKLVRIRHNSTAPYHAAFMASPAITSPFMNLIRHQQGG